MRPKEFAKARRAGWLNVSPVRKGWVLRGRMTSAVGAALYRTLLHQPDFAVRDSGTTVSNEINPTESINHLIWTAMTLSRPCGTESGLSRRL